MITTVVEIVKISAIAMTLMLGAAVMPLIERKMAARFRLSYAPGQTEKFSILQPVADIFKLLSKKEFIPHQADRLVYSIAPGLALVPALLAFAVIPVAGQPFTLPLSEQLIGAPIIITPWIADVNVGLLYLLAIGSLWPYGIMLAGWSSNNKHSLLSGLRAGAKMLSYQLSIGLAMLSLLVISSTMQINEIVKLQTAFGGLGWLIFVQPLAFLIFFISGLAQIGQSPFNRPETKNQLAGGFGGLAEYGGTKFGLLYGANYAYAIVISCIAATLFWGGWSGPFVKQIPLLGIVYFLIKVAFMLFLMVWVRASIPRLRFDELMKFCWKFLLPLGLLNLVVTALVIAVIKF